MAAIIYTKTGCPYCAAAKKHFLDQGVSFVEHNVTEDPAPDIVEEFLSLSPDRIVPTIVEEDTVTVGWQGGG